MATDITVAGADIRYSEFRIEVPLSPVAPTPKAVVSTATSENVSAGDSLSITIDGTTRFSGLVTSATIQSTGQVRVQAEHDAESLFEETVTLSESSPTDEQVLQAALSAANEGASYTLDYSGLSTTIHDDYAVEDRSVLAVFRDMADRTSRVWWVDPAGSTIHVETPGERGAWNSLDTGTDNVGVRKFDEGSVKTVRNNVTVNGTAGEKVTGRAQDSTSVSNYGRRSGDSPYNVSYISSATEADEYANELLIPEPLASGEVVVGSSVGSVDAPLVNYTIGLEDAARGISESGLVVEKQIIEQGRATLKVGEGSGVSLANVNRKSKSRGDVTEPGSVYGNGRIADDAVDTRNLVNTAVIESKLADAAVATSKLQNGAVINGKLDDFAVTETKIDDDSISTPKLQASAVTANEIEADTITSAEIAAGTITALEILADTITADEIAAGTITALEIAADTITANEVATNTLTASQIDTLFLNSDEIQIGMDADDQIEFATSGLPGTTVMRPTTGGTCLIGEALNPFDTGNFDFLNAYGELFVDPAGGNTSVSIVDVGGNTAVIPNTNDTGNVGVSGNYWNGMRANAYFTETPIPVEDADASVDCRTELRECDWYNPPAYVEEGTRKKQEKAEGLTPDENGELSEDGVEIATMANYLLEATKQQQQYIDDLEARVEKLEANE